MLTEMMGEAPRSFPFCMGNGWVYTPCKLSPLAQPAFPTPDFILAWLWHTVVS